MGVLRTVACLFLCLSVSLLLFPRFLRVRMVPISPQGGFRRHCPLRACCSSFPPVFPFFSFCRLRISLISGWRGPLFDALLRHFFVFFAVWIGSSLISVSVVGCGGDRAGRLCIFWVKGEGERVGKGQRCRLDARRRSPDKTHRDGQHNRTLK